VLTLKVLIDILHIGRLRSAITTHHNGDIDRRKEKLGKWIATTVHHM